MPLKNCASLSQAGLLDSVGVRRLSTKLHYTDTGYGHVVQHQQRPSSQQFYNLLYNKFAINGQKFATCHPNIWTCRGVGSGIAMW